MGLAAVRWFFVANAVRINVCKLLVFFGRDDGIVGMDDVPGLGDNIWLLLKVEVVTVRDFSFESQGFCLAEALFSLLIFQVRIDDFHHTWGSCAWDGLPNIEKDERSVVCTMHCGLDNGIVGSIICC